jgi:glutamate synthase (NADPH/NADH) small chain
VPNPLIAAETPELKTTKWGTLEVDSRMRTSMQGVWAGGDIITGGATVISAMGEGKRAASDMDAWIRNGGAWK